MSVGKDVEKWESSYIANESVNYSSCFGKQFDSSLLS